MLSAIFVMTVMRRFEAMNRTLFHLQKKRKNLLKIWLKLKFFFLSSPVPGFNKWEMTN
jgi:hypothetical protein